MGWSLGPGTRIALIAGAACVLAVAAATVGTHQQTYAPNNWLFSHTFLAEKTLEADGPGKCGGVASSAELGGFLHASGLPTDTLYARTIEHVSNSIFLHPCLIATLSAGTGLGPEAVARLPVAAVVMPLLVYASANLVLSRTPGADPRFAAAAPLLAAIASAPFVLETRALLPSTTILFVQFFFHMLLRRALLGDRLALPLGLVPLILLPFWYYTMAYFILAMLAGFVAFSLLTRLLRWQTPGEARFPTSLAVGLMAFMVVVLLTSGILKSQLRMVLGMVGDPLSFLRTGSTGLDYGSHLNRTAWRSAVLYAGLLALFLPFGLLVLGAVRSMRRREALDPADSVLLQWVFGGALFCGVVVVLTNVSFLNRGAIYLAPAAVVALVSMAARSWPRRRVRAAVAVACTLMVVATPTVVLTAGPAYSPGDEAAYQWMGQHVPKDSVVYGPMESSSVLFRVHGFHDAWAFHPTRSILDGFWYSEDEATLTPYLGYMDYVVMRTDMQHRGFEDFSPSRAPLSAEAYAKFERSPHLHAVFDNGDVQVYRVQIDLGRLEAPRGGPR